MVGAEVAYDGRQRRARLRVTIDTT